MNFELAPLLSSILRIMYFRPAHIEMDCNALQEGCRSPAMLSQRVSHVTMRHLRQTIESVAERKTT
jgi:hypothetical protein